MSELSKVVLVTGCSNGGIGFHICQQFAEAGCKVYATSRRLESMDDFRHPLIQVLAMDVTSDEDVQSTVQKLIGAEGQIDILVNNAGHSCIGPIADIQMEKVKETFDANVFGALRTAKAVFPHMASRKSGLIINVGSTVGHVPTPWSGIYCASKAALHSMTETLQMECTPFNIDVLLVAPAAVRSNFSRNQSQVFTLPKGSLYKDYLDQMVQRMWASQGKNSMPTDKFAKAVVKQALSRKPPTYISLGGGAMFFTILKWLPRTFVLYWMWRIHSRK
ncbi:oxidoreductase [Neolentinus lepideus HHB14362 ss-1]|uniref:Oxidoreductase n=1 Tax=Neolentinus lepideus HHB14362 ss-1 TaxID=1314782 RepID=A0A165W9M9_9AGAM|nr:oxidoreductase [Neolentinus lepideus HHB14362 ss-1]